ncbi:hypothetical protein COOONC_09543 [Cooperia oncophora]
MLGFFVRDGYESRRSVFARATAKLHDRRVTMDNVPPEYAFLEEGTSFLQHMSPDLHIYYSPDVIAVSFTLIRPVVWGFVPWLLMGSTTFSRRSQTSVGNFTPCTEKNQRIYERIFQAVRDAIIAAGGPEDIRIVLDFEKAAINAARRCFPSASVEGCAFHLARAWNKQRDDLGLLPQVRGTQRCRRIESWWNTIKGLIFLPPTYTDGSLRASNHLFLGDIARMILRAVSRLPSAPLVRGPFQGHVEQMEQEKELGVVLGVRYPPMADLIIALHGFVGKGKRNTSTTADRRRAEPKRVRPEDVQRRRRVSREMARFKIVLRRNAFIRTTTITTYCRRMSEFITEQSRT